MSLEDGMLLYHGSYVGVNKIDLSKGAKSKDFGQGFYLISNEQQAISFISTSLLKAKANGDAPEEQNYGYVTTFKYHADDSLDIYEFDTANKEWLWFISQNRRRAYADVLKEKIDTKVFKGTSKNPLCKSCLTFLAARNFFKSSFATSKLRFSKIPFAQKSEAIFTQAVFRSSLNADIIIGKIANDTTNPVITTYLNGLFGDVESDMACEDAIKRLLPDRLEKQFCFVNEKAISRLELVEVKRYGL